LTDFQRATAIYDGDRERNLNTQLALRQQHSHAINDDQQEHLRPENPGALGLVRREREAV
jgi:hypothetical protein